MAFLSAVIGVRDSSGVRVDSPDSLGNYLPIVLKLGSDLTSSVTQSGGVSVVTINATGSVTSVTGTAPITSSGGATPAIGISAASGGAAGSMSAAHYTLVNNATDAATASTLVKRDGSSVTKLAALELGATPSTTLGQLRATAGNVLSAKIGPAGEDRTILSTDNEHFLLGSTYGNVVAQIANGVTKFRVLDPFVLGPTAVAAEFGSAQIDLYNLVKLYGGSTTHATATGHVGLDSTGRLTVYADGAEKTCLVTGDAAGGGGGAPTIDAHHLGYWDFSEAAGNFLNQGADGSLDIVVTNETRSQSSPIGPCVLLASDYTSTCDSAASSKCQPTTALTFALLINLWSYQDAAHGAVWGKVSSAGSTPIVYGVVLNGTDANGSWYTFLNTVDQGQIARLIGGTLVGARLAHAIPKDLWTMFHVVYDGTDVRSYINGSLADTATATGGLSYPTNGKMIAGSSSDTAAWKCNGRNGLMYVRDQAMTAAQVRAEWRQIMRGAA